MQVNKISNRYLFISGASRGIGKACALLLNKLGYGVFAGVRSEQDATALKSEASANLVTVILDITDETSVVQAARQVSAYLGNYGLYGLINNAGIAVAGPLEFLPLARVREQFEVNVIGHLAVTQALMPLLRQGRGRIINMSSKEGIIAMPFIGPYCASKFALEALSDTLRMELKYWNIPVIVVEPGTIATEIIQRSVAAAQACINDMPRYATEMYDPCFEKAWLAVDKISRSAIPPDSVARTVARALAAKKPRTRYTVGMDAKALSVMSRFLPDRLLDKLILSQLGLG